MALIQLYKHLTWLHLVAILSHGSRLDSSIAAPVVVCTWPFKDAVRTAWATVQQGMSAVEAVVEGCSTCEALQCDGTVGFGGSPDENGETTLDAMIIDGTTMNVGAVGSLRNVKDAIRVAKLVLEHTEHTLLVGDQASAFALSFGIFGPDNLSTNDSMMKWSNWRENGCKPNFWRNVIPKGNGSCGPYTITTVEEDCAINDIFLRNVICLESGQKDVDYRNHDTISMAVIDQEGRIAAGTSTNGASFKIPGRVGDGPIVGAAAYADQDVGACGATGDGDVMMRFLPCYQAVENMRQGMNPRDAAEDVISRIKRKYPLFVGAVVALSKYGDHGGACHGWTFQYSLQNSSMDDVTVYTVYPLD